jgi:hypothetical protein
VTRFGVVLGLLAVLSAVSPTRAPAQSPEDLRPFIGTWTGTMTATSSSGSESGPTTASASFVLGEDGKWTLTCSGVASGTARRIGQRLMLEGKMTEGDSMAVGRSVSLILKLQGTDTLYGYGDSFIAGARNGGGISLRKVSGAG